MKRNCVCFSDRKGIVRKMCGLIRDKRRSLHERRNHLVIDALTMKDTDQEKENEKSNG